MSPDGARNNSAGGRMIWILAAVLLFAGVQWAWRTHASTLDTLHTAANQLETMRSDAAVINELRNAPQTALGRARPNEELLAQIERALRIAGIDTARWQDSIPQPPARIGSTDYVEHATRIYLENVTLRALSAFSLALSEEDKSLRVDRMGLTAQGGSDGAFDCELLIAYPVFAPQ